MTVLVFEINNEMDEFHCGLFLVKYK